MGNCFPDRGFGLVGTWCGNVYQHLHDFDMRGGNSLSRSRMTPDSNLTLSAEIHRIGTPESGTSRTEDYSRSAGFSRGAAADGSQGRKPLDTCRKKY